MYCFSASFCFICLKHYPKKQLLDINKNKIKETKIIDVLLYCGIDTNYCGDSYQVYSCEKCLKKLLPFYEFKQQCAKNFTKLKGYVTQMKANANVAFHANLKVALPDPKYPESNESIEYMDVSQFLETQIQGEETSEPQHNQQKISSFNQIIPDINPPTNAQQLYEISNFVYDNHFLNAPPDYSDVIELVSSPESFNDIPQNSSGSFNDVPQSNFAISDVTSKSTFMKHNCSVCNKVFSNVTQLSIHMFLHTLVTYPDSEASKSMKYYCALCTIDVDGLVHIKKHLLTHTYDNIFTCTNCKVDFLSYLEYNRHFSQNPSHKPFGCKFCDRRFITEYKLNVHTRQKHFISCMFCTSLFKTKPELNAHMADKHNNKFCYICSTSFKSNDNLKEHLFHNHFELQTIGGDGKPQYNCKNCANLFQTKYSLNEHLGGCITEKK